MILEGKKGLVHMYVSPISLPTLQLCIRFMTPMQRFNYVFGLPAFKDGRLTGRYNIDFCQHPEALCSNFTVVAAGFNQFDTTVDTSEIKYLSGLFYWMDQVESFEWGSWNYLERLKLFVDGGMTDYSFVDEFSDMVVGSLYDTQLRKANFKRILQILFTQVPSVGSGGLVDEAEETVLQTPTTDESFTTTDNPLTTDASIDEEGTAETSSVDPIQPQAPVQTQAEPFPDALFPSNTRVELSGATASYLDLHHIALVGAACLVVFMSTL